jgi:hypothetical protein
MQIEPIPPLFFSGLIADFEINFCLATQDPSGNATTGIRRQNTSTTAFSSNDAMKFTAQGGLDAWDRNKYLNLWVCDLSGGLLGYAQFPGGAASTDGVVLRLPVLRYGRRGYCSFQQRTYGYTRSWSLAQPAPHLGRCQLWQRPGK